MQTICICMIVVGSTLASMSMTNTEFNRLPVFHIDTMVTGNCITTGAILGTIERNTIDGNGYLAQSCSTLVITLRFRTVCCIMPTCCVVDWRTWNRPFIVLSSCTIVRLRTGQG